MLDYIEITISPDYITLCYQKEYQLDRQLYTISFADDRVKIYEKSDSLFADELVFDCPYNSTIVHYL